MIDGSVLIVGAGPSGLAMASALGQQGVGARIVDMAKKPVQESRALAIQARSLEIFDTWGIADEVVARGLPMHSVRLYGEDKHMLFRLDFGDLPSRFPYMLSLAQAETEQILTSHVEQLGFAIERDTKLASIRFESDCCVVNLEKGNGETEEARFQWVIGCDGAHSGVREFSHTPFEGKDYPQQFALADLRINWPLAPNEAHIFTSPEGILACFPMRDGLYRVVANKSTGASTERPDIDEIRSLVTSRGPEGVQVDDMRWSANFFLHSRLVDTLQRGRTLLVGDAAHIHSPALGQGMNTGIQDAANLGWKLALVIKGLADPVLISSYDAERWQVEHNVLSQTDFVTKVMSGQNRFLSWLRDAIGPLVVRNEQVATKIRELVSELSIDYSGSSLVVPMKGDGIQSGERAPDALLEKDGAQIRLFELLRGPGHHVVVLSDSEVELSKLELLGDEIAVISIRHDYIQWTPGVVDRQGDMARLYGFDRAYVIRPDGYIGAICDLVNLPDKLVEYARGIHAKPRVPQSKASLM